ncbi:MAG: hypothetical protein JO258_18785, partial [Alphaproteobacteria bacterium]|nr:hypothetical protein [Alphaproteobacteria bacterium]
QSGGGVALGFSTAHAGTVSGSATINLVSDGGSGAQSIDGLGQIGIGSQTANVSATIDNYVGAALKEVSGGGTFSQNGNAYTLNLGTIVAGTPVAIAFEGVNAATGPADLLSGSFAVAPGGSGAFANTLKSFSGIGAGGVGTVESVALSTTATGTFTETINFTPTGSNASGYSAALPMETLTITGTVVPQTIYWQGPSPYNRTGSFAVAGNWSPKQVPNAVDNAVIAVSGFYIVTSAQNETVDNLNITNGCATLLIDNDSVFTIENSTGTSSNNGTIVVVDESTLQIGGSFANNGVIALGAGFEAAVLKAVGTLTLTGCGAVLLSGCSQNAIAGGMLVNQGNLIAGAGDISAALNNSMGTVNAFGGELVLNGPSLANAAVMEATNCGTLTVDTNLANSGKLWATAGGTVALSKTVVTDSAAGAVYADCGSSVELFGSTVSGGNFTIAQGGTAEAEQGTTDTLSGVAVSDAGNLVAEGTLILQNTTVSASGGSLAADGKGLIELKGASVTGGTLSGPFETVGGTNVLAGLTNQGTVTVENGTSLTLQGTIQNKGTVALASSGAATDLIIAGNVTVNGGTIALQGSASGDAIVSNGQTATLTNVGTIAGAGLIGDTHLTLNNKGVIDANTSKALTLNTGPNTIVNANLLEATAAGGLTISGALTNNGQVAASGGNVTVAGAVGGTGTDTINGSTLTFLSSVGSGQTISFASGKAEVLDLGLAQSFAGTVAGLATGDAVDLANFAFGATESISGITGNGAKGTDTNVTIKDGSLSATLHLLNQFANQYSTNKSAYQLVSDNSGTHPGTLFELATHH